MMNKVSDLCPTCPIQPSRFQAVLLLFRWRSHFLSNPHDLKRCRKERSRVTETWGGQHIHCVSLLYPLCFCFCVSIHCVSVSVFLSTVFLFLCSIHCVSVSVFLSTVFLCSLIDRPAPDLSTHTKSASEIWQKSSGFIHAYKVCYRDLAKVLRMTL